MARSASSLRRRLENSALLLSLLSRFFAGWFRLCHATSRWQHQGGAELREQLARGPVVLVLWHSRLVMAPFGWPGGQPLSTLHDSAPIARLIGTVQTRLGLSPIAMSRKQSNLSMARAVLTRLKREQVSVGIAADGPRGPARVLGPAPLDWARAAGAPVWAMGTACRGGLRARSWDRLALPLPFMRGAVVLARWQGDPAAEGAAAALTAHLDAVTARADALVGLPPQP